MKKLMLMIPTIAAMGLVGSCGPSAEEVAAQRKQDSIDSIRRADSLFKAQTADMLIADTVMRYNAKMMHVRKPQGHRDVINPADSLHNKQLANSQPK